ncbi:hypothetical protein BDP55DRAFT_766640 [Colletotrichum godetiae]|uniref:Uncharacterized protein n=1 Tax=Colletotrichum godetiae TaxID=1209918 RepID=A0AAJ0F092_9PEZI|nr:uncharacterized protein BDP55DRAFT_766640 [Colletotrichum godetiae]KAK1688242.1 hypothetical protein BDP55DRAFT_766640 [Colletotrichum godetiae]
MVAMVAPFVAWQHGQSCILTASRLLRAGKREARLTATAVCLSDDYAGGIVQALRVSDMHKQCSGSNGCDYTRWAWIGQDELTGWPNQFGTACEDCSVGEIWLVYSVPVSWFYFGALSAVSVPYLAIGDSPSTSDQDVDDDDDVDGWQPTETCDYPTQGGLTRTDITMIYASS